jgi:hypothetical protein
VFILKMESSQNLYFLTSTQKSVNFNISALFTLITPGEDQQLITAIVNLACG